MKRRNIAILLTLAMLLSIALSACTKKAADTESSTTTTASSQPTSAAKDNGSDTEAPVKNLTWVDSFPAVPKPVDYDKSYAYDDMSKHYTIDIMNAGYANQPAAKDPIKDFFEKTFNVTINFTHLAGNDLVNKTNVRFASGDAPDMVHFDTDDKNTAKNTAVSLFKSGQLLDATKVLPYMPQMMTYMTTVYKNWATDEKGNMVGIPSLPLFPDNQGLFIRQDWLKKLNMDMPKTPDDMFKYAKAVVEQDPDGNGKADTWFMGTAGEGQSLKMLEQLRAMFGHPSWNVKDGKINYPVLDGTDKNFLAFLKKLNDNKLLSPDWYTISWSKFSSYSMENHIGMVNYPAWNLIQEQYDATKDLKALDYWVPVPPPSMDGNDGKYLPGGSPGGIYIISKKASEDPGKLMRLAHFLDAIQYPNKYYWAPNQFGGPDIFPELSKVVKNDDGTYYYDSMQSTMPIATDPEMGGAVDWQAFAYTLLWEVHKHAPDVPYNEVGDKYNKIVEGYSRHTNYDMSLSLDGTLSKGLKDFESRNEIQFILGKRSLDDWDKYTAEWKKAGGQQLLEQAAAQLKVSLPE